MGGLRTHANQVRSGYDDRAPTTARDAQLVTLTRHMSASPSTGGGDGTADQRAWAKAADRESTTGKPEAARSARLVMPPA